MTFDIATQLGATIGRRTPTSFDMATRTGAAITRWTWFVLPVTVLIDLAQFLLRGNFKIASQYFASNDWQHHAFGLATITVLPALFVVLSGARSMGRGVGLACLLAGGALSVALAAVGFNTDWLDIAVPVLLPLGVFIALAALGCLLRGRQVEGAAPAWASLYWRVFALALLLAIGI